MSKAQFILIETEFGDELMINLMDINTIEQSSKDHLTDITYTDATGAEVRVSAKVSFRDAAAQLGPDLVRTVWRRN